MADGDSQGCNAPGFTGSGEELLRAISDAMLDPQVLLDAVRDANGRVADFVYRDVNHATCDYLGLAREELIGRGLLEMSPGVGESGLFAEYVKCLTTGEPVIIDNLTYDNEILDSTRRYDLRATRVSASSVSLTWRDVTERFRVARLLAQARELQQKADARYRRLMDNSGIGMGLLGPEGRFQVVNAAMCRFFGYDADTLREKTWQELTAPDYLDVDQKNVDEVLAGRIESYRMNKQYIHADGNLIWGDLSVSCLRSPGGEVENFVAQIIDITAEVLGRQQLAAQDERNRLLANKLQAQTDRLTTELRSAAAYVASILPAELDGPVRVHSRYLPSQELAGDIFDYRWLDDDHLIVYLIDVSGHGIGPALLSVSVHNMLRSRFLPPGVLLAPEQLLSELNRRFQMVQHDDRYLTMWIGVYELSSRTLRYASAGAPPALVFSPGSPDSVVQLATDGQPLGMFDDNAFPARSYVVPHGLSLLLFSDGAFESIVDDGQPLSIARFGDIVARLPESSESPLGALVESLSSRTPSGTFEDDCSLVLLEFD